jgi:hypothetical protein
MKYLKTFENTFRNFNNDLIYLVKEKELSDHGYDFRKLFASNYKVYFKEINNIGIWCWVKGKTIEIKDYYDNTINIINYYIENINNKEKLIISQRDHSSYLNIKVNSKTGEIISFKDVIKKEDFLNSEYMIDEDWRTVIMTRDTWDAIIDELVFLTEGKIKENPNYKKWELNRQANKFNI